MAEYPSKRARTKIKKLIAAKSVPLPAIASALPSPPEFEHLQPASDFRERQQGCPLNILSGPSPHREPPGPLKHNGKVHHCSGEIPVDNKGVFEERVLQMEIDSVKSGPSKSTEKCESLVTSLCVQSDDPLKALLPHNPIMETRTPSACAPSVCPPSLCPPSVLNLMGNESASTQGNQTVSFESLVKKLIAPCNPALGPPLEFSAFLENFPQDETEGTPFEGEIPDQDYSFDSAENTQDNSALPLFQESKGAKVTVHDAMIAILTWAQSAHLSGKSTTELLGLLEILLPQPNNLPKTSHMFKKYFSDDNSEIQIFFFCSKCYKSRSSAQDICKECAGSKKVGYFVVSPLDIQLQRLYSRPGFSDKLKYKSTRKRVNSQNIEDVYDGSLYKEAEKGILADDKNISLTWYTDGVSVFECSTYSLWPSMYIINELPPEDRHKPQNVLIGGLWGGDSKPHPNIFLMPQYHEIKKLNDGIPVKVHNSDETLVVKAILLYGCCDSPAKSAFMNMKCHSGYCSCPKCFIQGEKSSRTGNVLVFPHEDHLVLRNDENYSECTKQGVLSKDGHKGVFGPTVLSYMFSGSFISGMTIDVMHSCYMGLTKQMLKLWFDVKYKDEPFSLCEKMTKVNDRLAEIHLPHFVQRLLIEVDKSLAFWKASLCRNFLLYIVVVLLKDIQPDVYFNNLCMLVEGISLLNSSSISSSDLKRADELLFHFCKDFEKLYGVRHMSFNLHLLRHLAQCVYESGNLYFLSCFRFEDLNGQLAALVHGTRHIILQILSRLKLVTDLPLLIKSVHSEDVKNYCKTLTRRSKNFKLGTKISSSVFVVGELTDLSPHQKCVDEFLSVMFKKKIGFRFFDRLYKDYQLYVSSCYDKGSRISCYCAYESDGQIYHGRLLTFVKTDQDTYYVFIERSNDLPTGLHRFIEFIPSENRDLITVSHLVSVSFCLNVDGHRYLVDPLNSFELE